MDMSHYIIELINENHKLGPQDIPYGETLGIIQGTDNVVPYLIKNTLTDLLEDDHHYRKMTITEKYDFKKRIKNAMLDCFSNNQFESVTFTIDVVTDQAHYTYTVSATKTKVLAKQTRTSCGCDH